MDLIIDDTLTNRRYVDTDRLDSATGSAILTFVDKDNDSSLNVIVNVLTANYHLKSTQRQVIHKIIDKYNRWYLENKPFDTIDATVLCKRLSITYNKSIKTYEGAIEKLLDKGLIEQIPNTNRIKLADKINIFNYKDIDKAEFIVIKLNKEDNSFYL